MRNLEGTTMRFAAVLGEPPTGRATWHDRVRRVDDAGFDVVLVPDHLGMIGPLAPLVSAAEAAPRLRVGTQVLNNEFWNPALLAREAAMVDLLTDGRLELGFGAGHAADEFAAVGLAYDPPVRRIERLEAAVPIVRRLLAGETVTADAPYRLHDCALGFAARQARVPIMVGGNGDRVLRLAAREADIVGFVGFTSGSGRVHTDLTHFTWDGLADRVRHVAACTADRVGELELSVLVQQVAVTDDRRAVAGQMAAAGGVDADVLLDSPFVLLGSTSAIAEQLARLRDELGIGYVTTFEHSVDPLATARPV